MVSVGLRKKKKRTNTIFVRTCPNSWWHHPDTRYQATCQSQRKRGAVRFEKTYVVNDYKGQQNDYTETVLLIWKRETETRHKDKEKKAQLAPLHKCMHKCIREFYTERYSAKLLMSPFSKKLFLWYTGKSDGLLYLCCVWSMYMYLPVDLSACVRLNMFNVLVYVQG